MTVTVGLLVQLEAKPGKEDELASFLEAGRALAMQESGTVTWYAFRTGLSGFGIFDTFETEDGRQAHLAGEIAKALGEAAPDLLARNPEITSVDVLAAK
ncbi:putative quinol monooxygenase [Streptomyces sp. NBC_00370]|uniref:putative quinol monooxygenase n=1 Tax=Streptomyces sp. NBC_00370 TaxID=2975728 RepID=UPI002E269E8E